MERAWEERRLEARAASAARAIPLPWLTVEVAIYGVLTLVALVVRLAALGRWPLQETGVNTALAAWRTMQGSDWRPAYYIPLLYDANLLLFGLTKASDWAARLLPALAGSLLVILPYFARDLLGRRGALAAALLLAFAPTWVYFSRAADGPILVAAAGALLLLSLERYSRSREARHLTLGVVALAVGLTAGPGFYTLLLATLLAGLVFWWDERKSGLLRRYGQVIGAAATRRNALWFGGTLALLATGFTVNIAGVGATAELAGRWFRALSPASTTLSWWELPTTLATYEFLTIGLALVGVVSGLMRRERVDIFLLGWFLLALLLGTALGHREPIWLVDALLPLVLLAARGLEWLWERLSPGTDVWDGLALLVLVLAIVFTGVQVTVYIHTGQVQALRNAQFALGFVLIGWAAYWVWSGRVAALRAGVACLLLVMVTLTVRASTAVAYQYGADPRERLVGNAATSVQMRDLEELIEKVSSQRAVDPRAIDIAYAPSLDPWMGWYLREYPRANVLQTVPQQADATIVIAPAQRDAQVPSGSVGQRFRWIESRPDGGFALSLRERLRWFLLRQPVGTPRASELEVWVRLVSGR